MDSRKAAARQAEGLGFWLLGFGFRVLGFGFRVALMGHCIFFCLLFRDYIFFSSLFGKIGTSCAFSLFFGGRRGSDSGLFVGRFFHGHPRRQSA